MGQKLFEDKIGTLTNTGANITLGPSRLTIGGQQYSTNSNLIIAADLSAANTRFQVYATLNAGAVQLVISQNENSTGPTGHSTWKLVGSYYTNGLSPIGFGSFVNITGTPNTNDINSIPELTASTTNPNLGSGGSFEQDIKWSRRGKYMIADFIFRFGSAGVSGGSGAYRMPLLGFNRVQDNSASFTVKGGLQMFDQGASQNYPGFVATFNTLPTDVVTFGRSQGNTTAITVTNTAPFTWGVNDAMRGDFEIAIQEWSNTPIEDL